jgi:hypothetical protein
MSDLGERIVSVIGEATLLKTTKVGLQNAERNRPFFGKTIEDLMVGDDQEDANGAALVIVGGPSLHRKDPVPRILASGFKGKVVVADGSLGYSLRKGLVPDYLISVDPHPYRIVRWFGDPDLERRPKDDYFSRQDLDPEHWKDEVRQNQQLLELVNRHGPQIKAILATSVDVSVTERCHQAGMQLFWWNPLYDDGESSESISRKLFESNGIPCMVTGGNVGAAAWIFAHSILRKKHVGLLGMDLGYAPGTPLTNTQYFTELVEMFGDKVSDAYIHIHNPHLNETWYTDPTYAWYRKVMLQLVREAPCITYNCTEGGTLFGDGIRFVGLDEFLIQFHNGHRSAPTS